MKYDAFISYRHARLDTYVAKRIHKLLETFPVPYGIRKRSGKKKIARVFRDQEELPIGSSLTNNIEQALEASEFLIVICSPRTPESEWVQREIDTFIKLHDRDHVLAVLIEGEPDEAFPKSLLVNENGERVEPLAADVRGMSQREVNRKIKSEVVRLAAPLLYCSYDDLKQRHQKRRMRKMAAALSTIAVLGCAFGIFSTISASMIRQNYEQKQMNQSRYLADTSASLLTYGDRKTAAFVALEALAHEGNDRPYVPSAQYALSNALHCYATGNKMVKDGILHHDATVVAFDLAEDGASLVSVDNEERVRLWDTKAAQCVATIDNHTNESGMLMNVVQASRTKDGIFVAYQDGLYMYDDAGKELWSVDRDDEVVSCQISEDDAWIVAASFHKYIVVDAKTGKIVAEVSGEEKDFFSQCSINSDGSLVAVSCLMDNDEKSNQICLYHVGSGEEKTIKVQKAYVSQCSFVDDRQLAVISYDNSDDMAVAEKEKNDGAFQWIDAKSAKEKWCHNFDYKGVQTYFLNFAYSSYAKTCALSNGDELSVLKADDGKVINQMNYGQQIKYIQMNPQNKWGVLANSMRKIQLFRADTGEVASYDFGGAEFDINSFEFSNGELVILGSKSNDLLMMNYAEGPGMKIRQKMDEKIQDVLVSEDESIYALFTEAENGYKCTFFDENDKQLYETENLNADLFGNRAFFSGHILVLAGAYGRTAFVDPDTKSVNEISAGEDFTGFKWYITQNHEKIVYYSKTGYCIVDCKKQKITQQGTFDVEVDNIVYAPKKECIYAYAMQDGWYCVDVKKNQSTKLQVADCEMLYSDGLKKTMDIDLQEKYLAVSCSDSMLRVLNLESMKTVCEIPFDGRFHCTLAFMPDGKNILYKGDDNLYKVYNYMEQKYTYIGSSEMSDDIDDITMSGDAEKIVLSTESGLFLLDALTYDVMEYASEGCSFLDKSQKVLSVSGSCLYEFPYMDIEKLVQEVKNQYGDVGLAKTQKIKYNIE